MWDIKYTESRKGQEAGAPAQGPRPAMLRLVPASSCTGQTGLSAWPMDPVTSLWGRIEVANIMLEGDSLSLVLKYTPLSRPALFCCLLCLTCWTSLLYTCLHSWFVVSSSQGNWEQPVCKHPLAWDLSISSSYNIIFCNWLRNIISLLLYIRKIIYPEPLVLKWHKRQITKYRSPWNYTSNYSRTDSWQWLQLFSVLLILPYKLTLITTSMKE